MSLEKFKKIYRVFLFYIGWVLSPFTWWNDAFVNMPISYIIANIIFYFTRLQFGLLVIWAYCMTNLLGMLFIYLGGKGIVMSSKNKLRSAVLLVTAVVTYLAIMIYLDKKGKLLPLSAYFEKYCVQR